jgi:uncharacterized protein (TIGR00725 family)
MRPVGARVIAVIGPGAPEDGPVARDAEECGRRLAEVATGMGEARDLAVVASAQAVIAVGGGWGTLAEIGLARKLGRPVVRLRSWRIAAPEGEGADVGPEAATPAEAVRLALEAAS